jgi:nitroreductase
VAKRTFSQYELREMEIAVPGWFHTLQSSHFSAFDQILSKISSHFPETPITLHLIVFPVNGFDSETLRPMLLSLGPVSGVTFVSQTFVLDDEFLAPFPAAVLFTPNFFIVNTSRPIVHSNEIGEIPFILEMTDPHPDISVAGRLFHSRYSPREFLGEAVPEELLRAATSAARRAPSAGNLQAYSITLITNRSVLDALSVRSHQNKFADAPAVFAFIADRQKSATKYRARGAEFYAVIDATIACTHLQLALEAVGVNSRWIGAFKEEGAGQVLGVTGSDIVGFLIVGFGVPRSHFSSRRPQEQMLTVID